MQIADLRGDGLIILWQQVDFELLEIVSVGVPTTAGLNRHERHAGLDESPSQ